MKKLFALILSVCLLLSVLALAVSAEEETVNFDAITMYAAKGTPEAIDGVMDEIYKKAPEIKVEGVVPQGSNKPTRERVTLRILWDENYLYTFFDITDPYITPEEHEKQWTKDYTDLNAFWNGDGVNVLINTSGKLPSEPADYRSEPGVRGCGVYCGGVNYGLTGNKPYAGAGYAAMLAGKTVKDDDPDKEAKEAAIAEAKAVLDACWYQTKIVTNEAGRVTGWTCEMKIKFDGYTPQADDVIGFVAQIDCDDKADEKTPGNFASRECRLYTNPKALEQNQLQCYDNTNYFDKLVLALEPNVNPEQPEQPEQPTEAPEQPTKAPEQPTEAPTEKPTEAPTEAPKNNDAGCASSVAELALLTPLLAGFALLKKKKKSE